MSNFATPTLPLNDGKTIPQLGFGTYKIAEEDAAGAVAMARETGYELVDTAAIYENERGVGQGLGDSENIFLTTKIWNSDQGYKEAREAFQRCLDRLGRDKVDLVLIHWPCPEMGKFLDTWKAFVDLRELGKTTSIGVSNFRRQDIETLITETGVKPALNQVELHPSFQQRELREFHESQDIVTQCWSPLGQGNAMDQSPIRQISEELGMPASTVVLAWHLHHGLAPIPKASSRQHIEDNFSALRVTLTEPQITAIDELDSPGGRIGPDPANFNS